MSQTLLKRRAAIIGCGPVGMLGSLLFQRLGIGFVALQRFASPRSHPSAHWLSANSKVILNQIPNLVDQIDSHQQPWDNFRYYRYVESLFGHQLGITDHFQPNIEQKLRKSRELFGQTPNHIPQNLLLKLMYEKIQKKQNLIFDTEVTEIQKVKSEQTGKDEYILLDSHNKPIAQVQYVIMCSGINTPLRNKLPAPLSGFHMQGKNNLMSIINIHFTSKKLADKLQQQKHNAMLHFIYGKKIIGILVNHSIQNTGTFVLQIPNYEPFVNLLQVYSARDLIAMMFESEPVGILDDLNVIHVGKWKLQGILADSMHKSNIFLAGDAAHAYPPAGGFGMNSGFQDIHELAHALFMVIKNEQANSKKIFTNYSQARRQVNSQYMKKALQNYEITKNLSIALGYSPNVLDYFATNSVLGSLIGFLPKIKGNTLEAIRLKAMQVMYRRKLIDNPGLNLFFDQFDYSIQKLSKVRPQIMKQTKQQGKQSHNLYARQGEVSIQDIKKQFGEIKRQNIKFYDKSDLRFPDAQKLIHSNGNVLIQ